MLERLFQLKAHNTTVRTEVLAGLTTFLTMAYILFVNPEMLAKTGMDHGAVFVATCLAAAIGSAIMGLVANYPIALAPGMGLNAFFTYTVVMTMGHTWQVALGAVFLSGVIFFLLSIFKIREWIINSIPMALRAGIAAGIGLFLAIIALKNAGIVADHPATLVTLGDLSQGGTLLACLGFFVIAALAYRKVTGAVMIGILLVTALSILFGLSQLTSVVSMPPSLLPTLLQLDLIGALDIGLISVLFAFLFVDLFAAAGISAGGRAGLTACVVALLFLLSLFFAPLAGAVPAFATAPALLFVAVLMMSSLAQIDWDDLTVAAPVVVAALAMPLTFSIANGIAFGFIAWTLVKLLAGRWRELNPALVVLSLLFVVKLGWFA